MIGMGGLIGGIFVLIFFQHYEYLSVQIGTQMGIQFSLFNLLAGAIVVAGLVGSSRLKLQSHNYKELGYGFIGGMASQFIAYGILF